MSLTGFESGFRLPLGIGIDLVDIEELRSLDERCSGVFFNRTYTPAEQEEAGKAADKWSYLAGRFAVKEAAFKALAHLLPDRSFDFRIVETLYDIDGSPVITYSEKLAELMSRAGVSAMLVSITNEGPYAAAVVQAVKDLGQ